MSDPASSTDAPAAGARGGDSWPSRRAAVVCLAVLLAVALGLRIVWLIGWPDPGRSWDERYSLENIGALFETGSLVPVRNFYPSPVYFVPPAAAMLLARPFVDDPAAQIWNPESGEFGPAAYHVGRGIQALYGTGAVLLIFLLGAMLFDRATGLLAATTLAFIPWFVQVSGIFKPDAQVVFFVLLVLLAGARWMRSPTALGALGVAAALALATSSKLIAGVAGAAFGLGALVAARRARHFGQIVLAGVASVALFLLLNPHIGIVLAGIDRIKWDYARRAVWAGMTKAQIPERTLDYLLAPTVFGPLLGTLAVVGLAGLGVTALWAARSSPGRVAGPRLMLVAFPIAYVAVHTAQSAWFRDNNFTHILPPFVLGLSWLLVELLRAGAGRLRRPRPLVAVAVAVLLALLVPPGFLYVYSAYVPSTRDAASDWVIHARHLHGRVVFAEPVAARGDDRPTGGVAVAWQHHWRLTERGIAVVPTQAASEIPALRLWHGDAVILRGDIPSGLPPAMNEQLEVFRPSLGRLRGPTVTVLRQLWNQHSVHGPLPILRSGDGELEIELPEIGRPRYRSIAIRVSAWPATTPEGSPVAVYGSSRVALHRSDLRDLGYTLIGERFLFHGRQGRTVRITGLPRAEPERFEVFVYAWAPPPLPPGFADWREWREEVARLTGRRDRS